MSRMLAFIAPRPLVAAEALGDRLLEAFIGLADLHGDGWGHAWTVEPDERPHVVTGLEPARDALRRSPGPSARSGILYLRFASAGSAVVAENLQPFVVDRFAFAHNGALVPRDDGFRALNDSERAQLRGTTDSEIYFALLRRGLDAGRTGIAPAIASRVADVRELYPSACLNAMLLIDDSLVVVQARGGAAPPLAAFAARGVTGAALPPGHDREYNALATTVLPSGARVVATTGVDTSTWESLADDTVHAFAADGRVTSAPLPA